MVNKKFDVIVVGELNVDLILNQIESFPEMGKEKLAEQMTLTLGSSSAIFASNLSSLGARVAFIGKIGNDSFGDLVIDSLNEKNVNTDMIIRDANLKTGATIVLNYDEDRAMITHPGAMNYLNLEDIKTDYLSNARHLHFSSYFLQPGFRNKIGKLFKWAKELGLTTSFDPQWDPEEKWNLSVQNTLPFVDVFLPNYNEFLLLTGKDDINQAFDSVGEFANTIVVKNGNNGSILWQQNQIAELPPYLNKNVVDAIGAGDSFNAGYIFKFINGNSPEECQRFANLTGAINTTAAGGTGAFIGYSKIMKLAKERFGFDE